MDLSFSLSLSPQYRLTPYSFLGDEIRSEPFIGERFYLRMRYPRSSLEID